MHILMFALDKNKLDKSKMTLKIKKFFITL